MPLSRAGGNLDHWPTVSPQAPLLLLLYDNVNAFIKRCMLVFIDNKNIGGPESGP